MENFRIDGLESYMLVSTLSDPRIRVTSGLNLTAPGEQPSTYKVHLNNQTLVLGFVLPTSRENAIGTMYYMASSEGLAKQEQTFIDAARDAGWNVIATTVEMTFSHRQQLVLGDDGETSLAVRIDNHLADRAYALESLIGFLEKERPGLLIRPTVLVGLSAGAIALPTVAARIGPPDAAVLIGGGENVAKIILTSPLFREHTTLVRPVLAVDGNQPTYEHVTNAKRRSEFAAKAFERCALDPASTARVLSNTPLLMVHAKYDNIVPAHTGDALHDSLGRPERWSYRTGHLGLCAMLPWKSRRILKWLEEKTVTHRQLDESMHACTSTQSGAVR